MDEDKSDARLSSQPSIDDDDKDMAVDGATLEEAQHLDKQQELDHLDVESNHSQLDVTSAPLKDQDTSGIPKGDLERQTSTKSVEAPFTVFSNSEKWVIIFLVSLATLFSPLTANIYYPAIPTIAHDLHESIDLINLTVTVYLIFQGLAPSFVGSLSDTSGRRPAYIICFVIYIAADIGLALQNNYAALMVLRCLQSSGSSGTVALANASVSDIVTSAQRGSAVSYVTAMALTAPAFGPVIGGLLAQYLGWHAIFWFLAIFAGVSFVIILFFLPETCRKVVGNGSIPPSTWNMSLLVYFKQRKARKEGRLADDETRHGFKARPNPLLSFLLFTRKESAIVLLTAGTGFAGFYMVVTSMTAELSEIYHLSTLDVGLCYIATGAGSLAAALSMGRFLDWNFRRHARRCGMEINRQKQQNLDNFPLERARLELSIPLLACGSLFAVGYGWAMQERVHLAVPLVLLTFNTFCLTGSFQGFNTLLIDLNRDTPGSASAAMNLARCWLGAGGTALVNPMLSGIGVGWTNVILAAAWLLLIPGIVVLMRRGPTWRKEQRLAQEAKEQLKAGEKSA